MFGSTNPFGQSSSSPFASQPVFGQTSNTINNPFGPKPFGSTSPFGAQTGSSIFSGTSTGVFGATQSSSPFPSSTTFGASSSPAFGSTTPAFGASSSSTFNSSQSPFGGSSAFGQKPVYGGFGSNTAQTGTFGSTAQPSQPAFGSTIFGSSTPFGGASQPAFAAATTSAFGATSTPTFGGASQPAFGTASQPAFGGTSQPAFGTGSQPAFGTTSQPAFGGASQPAFGTTSTPAFGATSSPGFGSTTSPTFGSTGGAFGVSSAPLFSSGGAFGASSTPAFGSSSSTFPTSTTPAFGASSAPGFSSSSSPSFSFASQPAFGQSSSTFGAASPFGAQSSPFGAQSTTFGQSAYGGQQRVGSRVVAYAATPEPDGGNTAGKLESISAMPAYKEKSHEELRWEDYQVGDKGGPAPAGGSGFGMATSQPNPLNPAQSFPMTSTNPFNSTSQSNMFAPKTPSFSSSGFGTSSTAFSSSALGITSSTSLFPTSSPFGQTPSPSPAPFGQTSSPSLFTSSTSSQFSFSAPAQTSNSAFNTNLFNTTAPATQTGTFGVSTSFPQNATPFGQSSLFSNPATGFGLGSSSAVSTTSNPMSFSQPAQSFSPFQSSQPQNSGFGFSTLNQIQPGNTGGLGSSTGILGQSNFGQFSATQSSAAVQPAPASNPFGTLPAMPQISVGRNGTAPSIQYGISSMPVVDKPAPVRISSLLTSRHLTQRRVRLPARKYNPKNDDPRFPFFIDDEETDSTPKADALFFPRENPRALVIRPKEQQSQRASAEKASPVKDTFTPVHGNGKIPGEARNPVIETEQEDESVKDGANYVKTNKKPDGVHDDQSVQKGDSYRTLSGHRAGEAAIVYEHGAGIEAILPKLRRSDYYTEPRIQELAAKERAEPGFCCHVKEFVVGRVGYGSIKFLGETDVRGLDLESLVQFNNREVIVYPDDSKKPPVGQGLNKPAEVTLLNIICMDKKTGRQFTEGPKTEKYKQMLKEKAEDQGAEFVSYDPLKGEWKFRVSHFSKYKLGDEDDWDVDAAQDCWPNTESAVSMCSENVVV